MGARTDRVRKHMWTDPLAPVGVLTREPDRQVTLLQLSLQSTVGASMPRATWPRLCDASDDAPRAVAAEVSQATDRDTKMAVAQVEAVQATKTPSASQDAPLSGNAASGPTSSTGPRRRRRGG